MLPHTPVSLWSPAGPIFGVVVSVGADSATVDLWSATGPQRAETSVWRCLPIQPDLPRRHLESEACQWAITESQRRNNLNPI